MFPRKKGVRGVQMTLAVERLAGLVYEGGKMTETPEETRSRCMADGLWMRGGGAEAGSDKGSSSSTDKGTHGKNQPLHALGSAAQQC
jgi:hypothetical protein